MGKYLNPGNDAFREAISSQIYVDKSGLIEYVNSVIGTMQKNLCVSRPRRFGKSMTAHMLTAYYSAGCDSEALFAGLRISECGSFSIHLNAHNVIFLNIQRFLSRGRHPTGLVERIESEVLGELEGVYGECAKSGDGRLVSALENIYGKTGEKFIFIIDEWDCIFRERKTDADTQTGYLDFLRDLLKDQAYVELAYMTGILPIKKYGTHSALNMFYEYTMLGSYPITEYFGFTEDEVKGLCKGYGMDFDEVREWYDGYRFAGANGGRQPEYSIYGPKSVVDSMLNGCCDNYWTQTETYEALKGYIQTNQEGLKDTVVSMLAGNPVLLDTRHFQNDMVSLSSRDDVLTLLVHLGYLSYDRGGRTVSIPNREVAMEFVSTIESIDSYGEVAGMLRESKALLKALWEGDGERVASGVEKAHQSFPSIHYNNENALSCVLELAFYYAREYYTIFRELPTGKGFADVCFVPRPRHADRPAILMELKWDDSARGAIAQIESRNYPERLAAYKDGLMLVGINYDPKSKKHTCVIRQY